MQPSRLAALAAPLVLALPASAAIVESEPNDTLATADLLDRTTILGADVGTLGFSSGSDVDVFRLDLLAGDFLTDNTAPIATPFIEPDTEAFLTDASGVGLQSDDDEGEGLGSSFTFLVPADGTYYVAITGFLDIVGSDGVGLDLFDTSAPTALQLDGLDGAGDPHGELGNYILTVSVVPIPEPTLGLAAAGLAGLAVRRRRA